MGFPGAISGSPFLGLLVPKLGQVSGKLVSDPPVHVSPLQNKAHQPLITDRTTVTVTGSAGGAGEGMTQSRDSSHRPPRPDSWLQHLGTLK